MPEKSRLRNMDKGKIGREGGHIIIGNKRY